MQDMIDTLLRYGYVILFVYSLGGGMVGILAAGVLSSLGKMELQWCILVAFVANTLGSTLLYMMGKYGKKDLMPYFKKHRRKLALAMLKMKQYGTTLLFIQKFVYGLKTFIPIAAALAKYDFKKFLIVNTLASLLWAGILGYVAFSFGYLVEKIFEEFGRYSYATPLFLVVLVALIWFYLVRFSKK
ncbi:DedA family protein [Campylobacter helveticus]|uniref:DedA family protein n=1 Tax=Campylobacter helveticus TaxID=28898 RepID=A0AAX2UJP1_9BACT|nr:DedA family protein [Campylobacter helveticus]ARE79895.1 putative membrane protein, DedA family, type III (SNARE domain) [Campylobacter helveticus]MCR2039572.1 DedA family protein [Campylobacter helveticus]MCR2054269.1 DedA family protein [Campylobacter helveticus]MCR2056942.1 DedA family protein [Campylobacter helveticus]MCR2059669.1 DedA family protein [Campylobacter helveticus]